MNKNLNLSLYKNLIDLDFFLLNSNLNLNSHNLKHSLVLKQVDRINSLDLLELLKSLKQLIRLLQFLKKQTSYTLHIQVNNKQHYNLLNQFFSEYKTNIALKIETSFLKNHTLNKNSVEMLLILGEHFSIKNNSIIKRLFNQNIFLFNRINSTNEFNNCGAYKIFNDLFDFKKIIFLIILINQVFSTSNSDN